MDKQQERSDQVLIQEALSGNRKSLEILIKRHQTWIFNVALNLTADANEAADLMQEVLIKMVTNLSRFERKSQFRTWLYRIIKNHFLNTKRKGQSSQVIPWEEYAQGLDATRDKELTDTFDIDKELLVEEAKLSCMKAMLLCLTPEQRLVYVLGELFETPSAEAAEVMGVTAANFRKQLSRTREQLYNFMNEKCGLINKTNPCRCARKTTGFIQKGYVDPKNLQFQREVISKIEDIAPSKLDAFENKGMTAYKRLYKAHNYQQTPNEDLFLKELLTSSDIKESFGLN
ncbi:MAG: RNA polymerase sigma factor [Cytophagales bacterium]|nr:RNA polymerase sigma factor [Cytophagales bacterium]